MVGVEFQRNNKGIKGTCPCTFGTEPKYRMGVGEGSLEWASQRNEFPSDPEQGRSRTSKVL